ncbi:nitrophenyl compound nitroreductase subunit ArsF family protein [Arcticibacter eurypsychrophilus]|uniref:nitrophenyl compound nitroreductase subunit ArsF family protein n=1 Tax=Arcticibacter eurypsychrophilus TaxID=1434752 RepID=UPI00084CEB9D|nr:nitrophenyl compound nitroreductase subunit ArsF family protein [Arcticibacter eurypsychrophilus]
MKNLSFTLFAIVVFMFVSCTIEAQQKKQPVSAKNATIEVIQFHSEYRCMTCHKIEDLTKATLASSFKAIPFRLINVSEKSNAKMAEQFEASGTALFLYNPSTGKKKDLTSFAFMKAGNKAVFEAELKKHIANFIKG